jgi:anti-sigma-K factor RskA
VLVVLGVLATVSVQAERRADRAEEIAAIVADPAGRSIRLTGRAGTLRLAVSPNEDAAVVLADDLAPPPDGKTYALWYERGGRMEPAGLFAPDDDGTVQVRVAGVPTADVGVTIEQAGGSDTPTLPIIAQGSA